MTTRVQVRDTAGNVFAYHDCSSTEEAIAFAATFIAEDFRVEVIPFVPVDFDLHEQPLGVVLGFER